MSCQRFESQSTMKVKSFYSNRDDVDESVEDSDDVFHCLMVCFLL